LRRQGNAPFAQQARKKKKKKKKMSDSKT